MLPNRGRRRMLATLAAAASLPWLPAACTRTAPLRVAVQPWCGYQFLWLAAQVGGFGRQAIELLHAPLASDSVHALQAGSADAAALTLDEVIKLRAAELPLTVVMVFDVSAGADVLLARPGIDTPAALEGCRVGLEDSTLALLMQRGFLESTGLEATDIEWVTIGADHVAEWDDKRLDAVVTYDPARRQLLARGLRPIFDSRSIPRQILDVLAVRSDRVDAHGEQLTALIRGHFIALERWRLNPIDSAHDLAPRLQVRADEVQEVYRGLDLPDLQHNLSLLAAPAEALSRSARIIASRLAASGRLAGPFSTDRLFSADWLPRTLR